VTLNELVSSTPIAPINSSIIPPTPTMPPSNTQQQHHVLLLNEHYQSMLKKIWNIFEYSICFEFKHDDNGTDGKEEAENLMLDRHLDQMLMCSIYGACKATGLSIKFQDIMKHYRLINDWNSTEANGSISSQIYRSIRIDDETNRGDLIMFYNQVFLRKLKIYIGQLHQKVSKTSFKRI